MKHQTNFRLVGLVVFGIMISGCMNTIRVHKGPATDVTRPTSVTKLKGLPFYLKKNYLQQTTVYTRSVLEVSLQITVQAADGSGKPVTLPPSIRVVTNDSDGLGAISQLRQLVASNPDELSTIVQLFNSLPEASELGSVPWSDKPRSNKVSVVTEIDTSTIYYINARAPWFGSGNLSTALAADGTLTSAEATVDSKLADAIPAILPIKEFLESEYVTATDDGGDDDEAASMFSKALGRDDADGFNYRVGVAVQERGEILTLTKRLDVAPDNAAGLPAIAVPDPLDNGTFAITPFGQSSKGKDSSNSWQISGAVIPPKTE